MNDENKRDFTPYEDKKIENVKVDAMEESDSIVQSNPAPGFLKELYEWTQAIAVAVVLALVINQFIFSIVQVNGSSMIPTLHHNERLFVFKAFYKPKNKDIVIINSDEMHKYLVKRVIATEGQTIDINEATGDVYVDGELLAEPYIMEKLRSSGSANSFPLTLPEGTIFVMGDNRNNSRDSRSLGVISEDDVMGKATFRLWPFDKFGGLYNNLK